MKYSLELFSGSKIVSSVSSSLGFSSWSVDINPKLKPSICCDLLDFDPCSLNLPFSFIWASPDCRFFSRAGLSYHWQKSTIKYRQYSYSPLSCSAVNSLDLLHKTLDVIEFYSPDLWIIENPIGRLRHIPMLKKFAPYRYSVNYQDWSHPFAKETDLYTNQLFCFSSKKVQRSGLGLSSVNSRFARSVVPAALVKFIIEHALFKN
jgi:hypothetical protein